MKKLDIFVLKKFLLLFAGSFFVCLFVFMMQFTWRFIDDLIGKGLSLDVMAQFFWYMALTLVPTSLPLAVLLASLITFGNMGESLELLSMKAAGVSLIRVMAPLIVFAMMVSGVSFYFQNKTSPDAQLTLRQLLISMRQTTPAVEIPEGVFYSGVPNVNLFVQRKVPKTGMLYQVIIYKTDQGFERAQIVLADSARMTMSSDKEHMMLDLWSGEQFENLQGNGAQALGNVPYDRETFRYKSIIIDFDSNFNVLDADLLRGMASTKNERQITHDLDSIQQVVDSLGKAYYNETYGRTMPVAVAAKPAPKKVETKVPQLNFDSIVASLSAEDRTKARLEAFSSIQQMQSEYDWRGTMGADIQKMMRLHLIEWHQKITLSLACLLFFFIGAPLGAAIGKGGLGLSTVISILIFILYYIVNTSGMKMGRQGDIPIWLGMWVSSTIMIPCSIWLTYKANLDKLNININSIWNTIKRFPLWRLLMKPWKISVRDAWSLSSMTKTAKMKATSSWPLKKLLKKQ